MDDLPDKEDIRNEIRARRMLMTSAALGNAIGELWDVYNELFRTLDLENPDVEGMMLNILAEFEDNLYGIMDGVQNHIYILTGTDEHVPVEEVEDFEASILRTISNLDEVNLEDYRLDYDNEEHEGYND